MKWEIRLQNDKVVIQTTIDAKTLEDALAVVRQKYPKNIILSIIGFKK